MVLLIFTVIFVMAVAGAYWCVGTRPNQTNLVRNAVAVGLLLGTIRAGLASLGWYVVEHTGGPFQVPAYALAMLAWPEAAILDGPRTTPAPVGLYVRMALLLVMSTTVLITAIAFLARRPRTPRASDSA